MNRNLLICLFFGAVALGFVVLAVLTEPDRPAVAQPEPAEVEGHVVSVERTDSPRVEPRTEVMDGTVYEAPPMGDPCAERLAYAEDQLVRMRGQVAILERLIEECESPAHTPWGNFLRLPESANVGQPARDRIKDLLTLFPVMLLPGEVEWLAERYTLKDWKKFADTSERAIIDYFGEARIRRELAGDPMRLAELKADYAEEGMFQ